MAYRNKLQPSNNPCRWWHRQPLQGKAHWCTSRLHLLSQFICDKCSKKYWLANRLNSRFQRNKQMIERSKWSKETNDLAWNDRAFLFCLRGRGLLAGWRSWRRAFWLWGFYLSFQVSKDNKPSEENMKLKEKFFIRSNNEGPVENHKWLSWSWRLSVYPSTASL